MDRLLSGGNQALVGPVGEQHSRLRIVRQLTKENFVADAPLVDLVFDRKDHLDAPLEVSWHPIGAAEKNLVVAAVAEIVDPRVLEKPPDDRSDADVLTDPRNAGAQTTNSAHQKIDLHARYRSSVQRPDDCFVDEGVELCRDVAAPTVALVSFDLPFYAPKDRFLQVHRRHQELVVGLLARVSGQ